MIWIIHFIVINFLYIISNIFKKEKFFIISIFIYSVFTFGQRWMTGEDFPGYLLYYIYNFKVSDGLAYFALQDIFYNSNIYFGNLIFTIYFINLFNNFRFLYKFEKNRKLLFYLYMFVELYFMQMSQIRQFIAISFFINAYYFSYGRHYVKMIINLILAVCFHYSAFIVSVFLFLKPKLNRQYYLLGFLVCIILPFLNIKFLVNIGIFSKYAHYLGSAFDQNLSIYHYLKYYLILSFLIIYIININIQLFRTKDTLIFNGILIYLIFYGLSFKFAPVLRISNYFKIFELVFLIYYIKDLRKFSKNIVKSCVVGTLLVFYIAIAIIDPFNISRYKFKPLQLYQIIDIDEARSEIDNFYD